MILSDTNSHTFFLFGSFYFIKDFPAWLNEGLSEYFGGGKKGIKKIKNVLRFSEVDVYNLSDSTEEAYAQATNMVIFLIRKYGKKRLVAFLEKCRVLRSSEKAFYSLYKITFTDFESSFLKRYDRKRRKT